MGSLLDSTGRRFADGSDNFERGVAIALVLLGVVHELQ